MRFNLNIHKYIKVRDMSWINKNCDRTVSFNYFDDSEIYTYQYKNCLSPNLATESNLLPYMTKHYQIPELILYNKTGRILKIDISRMQRDRHWYNENLLEDDELAYLNGLVIETKMFYPVCNGSYIPWWLIERFLTIDQVKSIKMGGKNAAKIRTRKKNIC